MNKLYVNVDNVVYNTDKYIDLMEKLGYNDIFPVDCSILPEDRGIGDILRILSMKYNLVYVSTRDVIYPIELGVLQVEDIMNIDMSDGIYIDSDIANILCCNANSRFLVSDNLEFCIPLLIYINKWGRDDFICFDWSYALGVLMGGNEDAKFREGFRERTKRCYQQCRL